MRRSVTPVIPVQARGDAAGVLAKEPEVRRPEDPGGSSSPARADRRGSTGDRDASAQHFRPAAFGI